MPVHFLLSRLDTGVVMQMPGSYSKRDIKRKMLCVWARAMHTSGVLGCLISVFDVISSLGMLPNPMFFIVELLTCPMLGTVDTM